MRLNFRALKFLQRRAFTSQRVKAPTREKVTEAPNLEMKHLSKQIVDDWNPSVLSRSAGTSQAFVLYEKPRARIHQNFMYALIGSQLLFWFSLAELAYRHFEEVVERDSETDQILKAKPASWINRLIASSLCIAVGLLISTGAHIYAKRIVALVVLDSGGKTVSIQSLNLVGKSHRQYNVKDLLTLDRAYTGHGPYKTDLPPRVSSYEKQLGKTKYIGLKSLADSQTFFVERQGKFYDPKLWDFYFFRSARA